MKNNVVCPLYPLQGIDPVRDAQVVQAGPATTRLAAMEAGQLDVAIFAAPEKFIAADRGCARAPYVPPAAKPLAEAWEPYGCSWVEILSRPAR